LPSNAIAIEQLSASADDVLRIDARLRLDAPLAFQVDAQVQVRTADGHEVLFSGHLADSLPVAWLPRGR
jgi:hypothetical protein